MSFPRPHGPSGGTGNGGYARQISYDEPTRPHRQPTYGGPGGGGGGRPQQPLPGAPPLSNYIPPGLDSSTPLRGFNNGGGAQRRPTVRGAVRGTVRELGAKLPAPPPGGGAGGPGGGGPNRALTRGKTLTRPDRFVAPAPLINPQNAIGVKAANGAVKTQLINGVPTLVATESQWDPWSIFVTVATFWAPRWLLSNFGLTDRIKQRAWKEKCALCTIAIVLMGIVGFLTLGLTRVLCPVNGAASASAFIRLGSVAGYVGVEGWNFKVGATSPTDFTAIAHDLSGSDITFEFDRSAIVYPSCNGFTAKFATINLCTNPNGTACTRAAPTTTLLTSLGLTNTTKQVGYDWTQLKNLTNYLVIDGNVLNLSPYMLAVPTAITTDPVDTVIRYFLRTEDGAGGKDATRIFYNRLDLRDSVNCLVERYYAGHIDKITPGCFISQLFLYVSLALIMSIVLARFFMACLFNWYLSKGLVKAPKNLKRHVISPAVMPEGANMDVGNTTGAAPWTNAAVKRQQTQRLRKRGVGGEDGEKPSRRNPDVVGQDGMISMATIGAELFAVCLVTCYSEGGEGIRTTLDSISAATYSDARKLLFVVCDGMITGHGEKMSTPDIVVGMVEADPRFGEPQAMSYLSIGEGGKAHNQAMVYAGHYTNVKGRRTPTIVVVKCGPPEESKDKKPGNRGKRDSQMILMNFFSRVTYNDRMSPLDYDLFRKVQSLMGVTPDFFEVCLMVDADTKIYPDSMGALVRTMQNDSMIMGVCGETRIANKRQSWVTAIQVFEYFISHHLAKAFESVFGGVTCLPGCFSMYRLKARKVDEGDWFPVLVQPGIVSEYSQSVVTTLHQKNLLLLGEDRFLTTLLLRTFPNRKMMFCPQARCRTVAPDTFGVLLSQRRRWINSTIHNLMELILVRNLCGTFCFSMQFVVFVDLIGTVVLPIAICLTYTLIINYIFNPPTSFSDAIPLLLLGAVLGLPAVLILITTFKIVYVGWMLCYLIALPIWNFVLPLYSFSKFDDFSWGETRKVQGERRGDPGHDRVAGVSQIVPLRRWEDWERSRLRKVKRDEKRRKEFEGRFGSRQFHGRNGDGASTYEDSVAQSDTASMFSTGDEDRWGMQIGQYSEDGPSFAPPPVGLYAADDDDGENETIQAHEMELVLEGGWDESPPRPYGGGGAPPGAGGYIQPGEQYGRGPPPPIQPPKLYSLHDAPLMQPSYSSSSGGHQITSSTSSLSSHSHHRESPTHEIDPFTSPYDNTISSRTNLVSPPPGASFSTGVERSIGHAKQRSLSSSQGADDAPGSSPTKEGYGWNGQNGLNSSQGSNSGGGRRY